MLSDESLFLILDAMKRPKSIHVSNSKYVPLESSSTHRNTYRAINIFNIIYLAYHYHVQPMIDSLAVREATRFILLPKSGCPIVSDAKYRIMGSTLMLA